MPFRALLRTTLLGTALLAAGHTVAAAQAPAAPTSPCADALYQTLRGKPLEQLSDREYEYFMQREKACTEYQQIQALANPPRATAGARAPGRDLRYAADATTQANPMGGVDIMIRNTSREPIIVTSVEVYDCINIRQSSCSVHNPRTRVEPGHQRRVLTIRYNSVDGEHSYRYRYHVSGVDS